MVFQNQVSTYQFLWTDDPNTTKIVFDTAYNKESKVYGDRPIIVYNTGEISSSPIVINDRAWEENKTQNSAKVTMVGSSIILKVLSRRFIEVEILKNEIFSCLVAIRTILPAMTAVHGVRSITASETQKFKQDEIMYVSEIQLSYVMQYVWTHLITQEVLNTINLELNGKPMEVKVS
jgi:hypothetical protein